METEKKKYKKKEQDDVVLVRIVGKDIRGDTKINSALTKISGISWTLAGAICKILKLDKKQNIQNIDKKEMLKIEEFIKTPKVLGFLKNRQRDLEDGEDKHISGVDLKLRKDFDIKRLRKIKSYKGIRHAVNLPVRGQRTKANFRRNRKKSVAATKKKK